jgi:hypothetical protein
MERERLRERDDSPCMLYNAVDASYGVAKWTSERSYRSANTSTNSFTEMMERGWFRWRH